jgi:hypothetical protein
LTKIFQGAGGGGGGGGPPRPGGGPSPMRPSATGGLGMSVFFLVFRQLFSFFFFSSPLFKIAAPAPMLKAPSASAMPAPGSFISFSLVLLFLLFLFLLSYFLLLHYDSKIFPSFFHRFIFVAYFHSGGGGPPPRPGGGPPPRPGGGPPPRPGAAPPARHDAGNVIAFVGCFLLFVVGLWISWSCFCPFTLEEFVEIFS